MYKLPLVAAWVNLSKSNTPILHQSTSSHYTDDSNAHRHCNGTLNSTAYAEKRYFLSLLYIMGVNLNYLTFA